MASQVVYVGLPDTKRTWGREAEKPYRLREKTRSTALKRGKNYMIKMKIKNKK